MGKRKRKEEQMEAVRAERVGEEKVIQRLWWVRWLERVWRPLLPICLLVQ